jgi:hypothetical protein
MLINGDNTSARPNAAVHRVDVSFADPSAVFEVRVGRTESTDAATLANYYDFLRGNQPTRQAAGLLPLTNGYMNHTLGYYYVSGGRPFSLHFEEPLEALKDWQSSTDMAVAVGIKRKDASGAIGYNLNVWHEEY